MAKNLFSDEKIKELAKSINADETTFANYFKIFQALYDSANPTSFTNYFHSVSLFELEDINKIKNEDSFLKAISSFINEVTFNKKNILWIIQWRKLPKSFKSFKNVKKIYLLYKKSQTKKQIWPPNIRYWFFKK